MRIKNFCGHLKTINQHRRLVRRGCFKIGLYKQGLLHDLSKYSPVEFGVGVRYWQGDRSPNNAEREAKGYSESWMHHKGRNKHHFEYWNDYNIQRNGKPIINVDMPDIYIAEMLVDRISACKVYHGSAYTDSSAWEYYSKSNHEDLMSESTRQKLEMLLKYQAENGEDALYKYIREVFLKGKYS